MGGTSPRVARRHKVDGAPLDESGMRNHPVTPMTDASLVRLMEAQSEGKAAVIPVTVIERGAEAIREALAQLREQGIRYAVTDTLTAEHLTAIGEATTDLPLVTGGSGIGGGLARALSGRDAASASESAASDWTPIEGRAVVFSGSASEMTNKQVAAYREVAPSLAVDVDRLLTEAAAEQTAYRDEVLAWVLEQPAAPAPLVYATADPEAVRGLQQRYGAETTSATIEGLFAWLAAELRGTGVTRFIVAGGETSGIVTTSLGVEGFHIGPQIAPGVPWVRSLDGTLELALKSGNFGDVDFFSRAQGLTDQTTRESR
ncbi:four-carbon acid sugar kinase family protein [Gulosibacter sediminis]|uniref:four-carbon acid sugar kinase family protein n=1 Tax=Gulosibacter sediminis TaxID=1729695 RepID=UPI0024A7DDC2|nr:four-carbon acid sugar kinase family protein [Gulosibacter sediminis]